MLINFKSYLPSSQDSFFDLISKHFSLRLTNYPGFFLNPSIRTLIEIKMDVLNHK